MADSDQYDVTQELQGESAAPSDAPPAQQPEQIGRYRIEKLLGKGGFGLVYLARDDQLDRHVAIKVPHAHLVGDPSEAQLYLSEARTVARLDHRHIVPVFDVGSTAHHPFFVVSRFIEGTNLANRIKQQRPTFEQAAALVGALAGSLHYAHKQGIVHRDVKPNNILLGADGHPYLVDFGLALREEDLGRGPRYAGTPSYMSPEQARGEGHRVDGRSDVFSLGVVLYELLAGRRPFRADTNSELLERVTTYDPRPLRQHDERIPKELQRICFKALSKLASQRYSSAYEMAEDLQLFLDEAPEVHSIPAASPSPASSSTAAAAVTLDSPSSQRITGEFSSSRSQPLKIVPKGLRSFDARDSEFFLGLVPGPKDRTGLPECLRFWKTRIETSEAERTFSVGLIYGPSGCGKSSLIKAGLLPRLAAHVVPIFIEATPHNTESRLLEGLRERCGECEEGTDLLHVLSNLRTGRGLADGDKVLIVLDQFEQWLHGRRGERRSELVRAIRQCDGRHVQCLVLVRDDFWMDVTRFMDELEVPLLKGSNMAAVDQFDLRHARAILGAFGRAFGALTSDASGPRRDEEDFIEQAVKSLAENGKVTSVRLALFAEMIKDKPWTLPALSQVGGAEGVGVMFLHETFTSPSANPQLRRHAPAARKVLETLLPETGGDIKGQMKSFSELIGIAGYGERRREFEDLINILDGEARLLTPTDLTVAAIGGERLAEKADSSTAANDRDDDVRYYQLTHDFMVPALRAWLTSKQKETRQGRAELRLSDRAAVWGKSPDVRHLPAWWEYLNIRLFTNRRLWTEPQLQMMRSAGKLHAVRSSITLFVVFALCWAGWSYAAGQKQRQAELIVANALTAPADAIPAVVATLWPHHRRAVRILLGRLDESAGETTEQGSRAALLLSELGNRDRMRLLRGIRAASPGECEFFVKGLRAFRREIDWKQAAGRAEESQDWRHLARLAIVALHLGHTNLAESISALRADPIQRTTFIDTFETWHGDLDGLSQLMDSSRSLQPASPDFRSAVCLAVGSVPRVGNDVKSGWKSLLHAWYLESDALTHSASRWTLKQWGMPLPAAPPSTDRRSRWHATKNGLTMIQIPTGEMRRSVDQRAGTSQSVSITRGFMLSSCEITVSLFRKFIDDPKYPGVKAEWNAEKWVRTIAPRSPLPTCPVHYTSWYQTILFCNWLSLSEGLTPAYMISNVQATKAGSGPTFDVEWDRSADGYRLPTEAEWEFACRAETTTEFSSGDDRSMLARYATFASNSDTLTSPVGSRMCNPWGLFDMHGNLAEWCWDWDSEFTEEDVADPIGPAEAKFRQVRGGNYGSAAPSMQAKARFPMSPGTDFIFGGFRVARGTDDVGLSK